MSDHETLVRTLQNDHTTEAERHAAFAALMEQFSGMVRSVAVGFLGGSMQADDVVQETFLAAWQNISSLRDAARFPGWLRRIALWECHYFCRARKPALDIDTLVERLGDGSDVAAEVSTSEVVAQIREMLWALPRPHREILILHYFEHFNHQQLAELLELTEGAVRKRLHDARQRTRGLYERWLQAGPAPRQQTAKLPAPWRTIMTRNSPDPDGRTSQQKIDAMHRPRWCIADDNGRLYWDLVCAAIRNDDTTLQQHIDADPTCARLEFWYVRPLHFAVREGSLESVRLLWRAAPSADVSALIRLAQDRCHQAVADFLREAVGAEAAESDLRLHEAVEADDTDEVARLLRESPGIGHRRDPDGRTALHLATLAGNGKLVQALLAGDVDIEAVDHAGFRAAHCALWRDGYWHSTEGGGTELLNELLAGGAADSVTLAAARGDLAAVQAFLAADVGAVGACEALEKRPLSAAVEGGHRELVRYLLDSGADPNLREGRICPCGSALMTATVQDDLEVARWLLEAGADPNGGIDSSGTPATRATSDAMRGLLYGYGGRAAAAWGFVQRGEFETLAAILRHCDDPFSSEDAEYLTTPYTAVLSGHARKTDKGEDPAAHEAMLQMFLQRKHPMPKLLTACKSYLYRVPDMTRQLLENGLDANLPDWLGRTPLHDLCVGNRHIADAAVLIRMFLEHGADLEAVDEEDRSTPLGIAAREGNAELVQLLLDAGGRPTGCGASWAAPLAWASRRGHTHIVALLQQHGA